MELFDVEMVSRLVELMVEKDLREIELQEGESKILLKRGTGGEVVQQVLAPAAAPIVAAPGAAPASSPNDGGCDMTVSPQTVLARIPGWEQAQYSRLHGGLTNRSWLVSVNGRRAVLKIDAAPRGAPYNGRLAEKSIQTTAARAGLANSVLYAEECVYLTDYLEGNVWASSCLDKDENLELLASSLRKLHSLPLTRRSFDAVDAARRYSGKIDVGKPDIAEHCLNIVKKMHAPHNLCCCHNDLVAGNIITAPELRFLDWEYACDNDPLFDLATVVAHHVLGPGRAKLLLDYYFDGDGERWIERLERQMKLYNALAWLWYASRAESGEHELLAFESRLT